MVDGTAQIDEPTIDVITTPNTGESTTVAPENVLLSDPTGTDTNVVLPEPTEENTTNPLMSDTQTPAITGSPGMTVDCQQKLPCQWMSADTQFSVTITNADNIGQQQRLSIEYSLLTSHDTEISIASTEPAVDQMGVRYEPSALTLGEGVGGTAQGVFGGTTIRARIEFDRTSSANTLASWSIGLSDAGLVRQPKFTNIPVGSATMQHADCANTLPCLWVSPDGDVTITLLSASGFGSTNRLSTNFKVETTRNAVVAIDSGATAVGIDGLAYRGRTHAIGIETGAQKITATAIPGSQVAGTVFFFRTQEMSAVLQNLSLIIYEDQPVPRWNPNFMSVPVQ